MLKINKVELAKAIWIGIIMIGLTFCNLAVTTGLLWDYDEVWAFMIGSIWMLASIGTIGYMYTGYIKKIFEK